MCFDGWLLLIVLADWIVNCWLTRWGCDMCMIHLWIWTWYNDIEWSWIAYMLWILRNYVWIVILYPWLYLSSSKFLLILYGLWWCNANPQWFTTYLSVWTGRWSAGCLVVAYWCRGVDFLFFMQVSRLGLWSRIVIACCLFDFVFWSCWDILLFEIWRIQLYLVWRSRYVYELYVVPLLCCVTWSLCMYDLWFIRRRSIYF
jgi:hypothetical protein